MNELDNIRKINIDKNQALSLEAFRDMDYLSVDQYNLPIELLMENTGYHLARLATLICDKDRPLLIGAGTGNNGGGGLVAARRLAGWGYQVYVHLPDPKLKHIPSLQLDRAVNFGVYNSIVSDPGIFIDAYLGFSQRFPTPEHYLSAISLANQFKCKKISLDIPTGLSNTYDHPFIYPDYVLTLAAMKKLLLDDRLNAEILLADIGIPEAVYGKFGISQPEQFKKNGLIRANVF